MLSRSFKRTRPGGDVKGWRRVMYKKYIYKKCTRPGGDVKGWRRVISHNDLREAAEIQFYVPAALAAVGA